MIKQKDFNFKSKEVSDVFNNHVRHHAPFYDIATSLLTSIVKNFSFNNMKILDLGCGKGNVSKMLSEQVNKKLDITNVDYSKDMLKDFIGSGKIINNDIINYVDKNEQKFDCIISFLTMHFIHPKKRVELINNIIDLVDEKGIFIMLEKFYQEDAISSFISKDVYYLEKIKSISNKEAYEKLVSLIGVLYPFTEDEVCKYGDFNNFYRFDFFRYLDFVGIVFMRK